MLHKIVNYYSRDAAKLTMFIFQFDPPAQRSWLIGGGGGSTDLAVRWAVLKGGVLCTYTNSLNVFVCSKIKALSRTKAEHTITRNIRYKLTRYLHKILFFFLF